MRWIAAPANLSAALDRDLAAHVRPQPRNSLPPPRRLRCSTKANELAAPSNPGRSAMTTLTAKPSRALRIAHQETRGVLEIG
ncbi:MAG: hypothetical protein DIU80_019725, partial [Chloroflexota bacterium]